MTIYEELYFNDLNDLMNICWSGAIDRLEEVAELSEEKQKKFVQYVIRNNFTVVPNAIITTTQINDFIWFDCDKYIEDLKNDREEE